eukprot:4988477-Prymnesium_polylepis.1
MPLQHSLQLRRGARQLLADGDRDARRPEGGVASRPAHVALQQAIRVAHEHRRAEAPQLVRVEQLARGAVRADDSLGPVPLVARPKARRQPPELRKVPCGRIHRTAGEH